MGPPGLTGPAGEPGREVSGGSHRRRVTGWAGLSGSSTGCHGKVVVERGDLDLGARGEGGRSSVGKLWLQGCSGTESRPGSEGSSVGDGETGGQAGAALTVSFPFA